MLIKEFQFFSIPGTAKMSYYITVFEVWYNKSLVELHFSCATEDISESLNDLYLIVYLRTCWRYCLDNDSLLSKLTPSKSILSFSSMTTSPTYVRRFHIQIQVIKGP